MQIANLLCKGNIAVSGHIASCERLPDVAEAAGAMKSIPLAVAGAFHTYDEFYEVGVGWVLRSLMKRIARKTKIHGVLE